ncbi:hypothetical protein [Amycolatopsis australiensis]|uniref:Uncharacterized protein n=1 Tax=Amycolatopsis australiensis TaxID=546364 RepID=A0A1K1R963_9PSEU|nr:hypothetical protein [Amycolatopsis australiensis]SFW68687.1 hypothetical protein SAMN04489730_2898 [Amycolatopsis australiensis]
MARRAPRRGQVTVAELLVRSAVADRPAGGARHREKPRVLRSLGRLRVFSVVAGALALTGGVGAAVSLPVERSAGAAWPPAGVEPPAVALVPLPARVVVPPAKPAPDSVAAPGESGGITPVAEQSQPEPGSAATPARRGKPAEAVVVKPKPHRPPKQAAPVRHEIPDVPIWSRGRPGAGPHHGGGHDGCGHHRR